MMDTTRIKKISSNFVRAQQSKVDGDSTREMYHLLSAAQDITELLKAPRTSDKDVVIARQYADSLVNTSIAIERILKEEINARNTL